MKIDSLKVITGNTERGASNKFGAGFAFRAYICLSVAIFQEFGDARSCEPRPIVATSGVFPMLWAVQDVFWSIAFSLALATTACVDGSFEANSQRIRSHLAQPVFGERQHAFRMRRVYIC